MDYLEDYRLIRCLRDGLPTDMNVYDAAALSAGMRAFGDLGGRGKSAGRVPRFHPWTLGNVAETGDRSSLNSNRTSTAAVVVARVRCLA